MVFVCISIYVISVVYVYVLCSCFVRYAFVLICAIVCVVFAHSGCQLFHIKVIARTINETLCLICIDQLCIQLYRSHVCALRVHLFFSIDRMNRVYVLLALHSELVHANMRHVKSQRLKEKMSKYINTLIE